MTTKEVLAELESLGTAQNRKIYARHGVPSENLFGVSYANLELLRKRIKVDQALAEELWATGNHDARILACKIADPATIPAKTIDSWSRDLRSKVDAGELGCLVARSPHAAARRGRWMASKSELLATAGWHLVCLAASDPACDLCDRDFEEILARIEACIHTAPNQARDTMNSALIAIGLRNPVLRKKAIDAARRIGKVEVDHGETGCKTPDAEAYILKAVAKREAMGAARGKAKGGC